MASLTANQDAVRSIVEQIKAGLPPGADPETVRIHDLTVKLFEPFALFLAEGVDHGREESGTLHEAANALSNVIVSAAFSQDFDNPKGPELYCRGFLSRLVDMTQRSLAGQFDEQIMHVTAIADDTPAGRA